MARKNAGALAEIPTPETPEAVKIGGFSVQEIDPKKVDAHPDNPRDPDELEPTHPSLVELMGLIRAQGQVVPALVRPFGKAGRYQVVLGHRRRVVALELGRPLQAIVHSALTDQAAKVLVGAENASHRAPDPLLEAEVIAKLVDELGSVRAVAEQLGRPVSWVALSANLRTLTKKVRAAVAKPDHWLAGWPASWLAVFARLSPEAQDQVLAGTTWQLERARSKTDVERALGNRLHQLANAPFDIEDATLVPKAGSCVTCPKRSDKSPGLFPDDDLDGENDKTATCRDFTCWDKKRDAAVLAKVEAVKADAPKAIVVAADGAYNLPQTVREKLKPASMHAYDRAKKDDKKAVKAAVIDEKGNVRTAYLKPRGRGASSSPKKAKPEVTHDEKGLEASKAEVQARRDVIVMQAFRDRLEDEGVDAIPAPAPQVVLQLAAAFGVADFDTTAMVTRDEDLPERKRVFAEAATLEGAAKELWPRVREDVVAHLQQQHYGDAAEKRERLAEDAAIARWVAEVIGYDLGPLERHARDEVPDKKWWANVEGSDPTRLAPGETVCDVLPYPGFFCGGCGACRTAAEPIHWMREDGKLVCGAKLEDAVTGVRRSVGTVEDVTCTSCRAIAFGSEATRKKLRAKKATPGTCRGCGATGAKVEFSDDARTLCARCAGPQPRGKAKPARGTRAART